MYLVAKQTCVQKKKFQLNRKKINFRDCNNICPSGLWTYNKLTTFGAKYGI